VRPPLASLAAVICLLSAGCKREAQDPTSAQTQALLGPRTIPVRVVQLVGACRRCDPALACSPADVCSTAECQPDLIRPENLDARIAEASEVYAAAGITVVLGSLEKYSAPDLYDFNSSAPIPWAQARFQLRHLLPGMPCDAWPDAMALTPRDWMIRASTRYSPPEAIPVWVTPVGMGGYGIYPWRARALLIDANQINRHRDTNFSHEIGHFLGLPHSFESTRVFGQSSYNIERGTVRTPQRPGHLGHRDFWEFVHRPGPPNVYYLRRDDIAPADEPLLRAIEQWDLSASEVSNCRLDQRTCAYSCFTGGEWLNSGDPRLRALSFVVPSPGGGPPRMGINIMDYRQSPSCTANGLAESQIQQLRRVLAADIPVDDQHNFPGATGMRPRLGFVSGTAPRARVDVDHDYREQELPPALVAEHPPWADDLFAPYDPPPALAASP